MNATFTIDFRNLTIRLLLQGLTSIETLVNLTRSGAGVEAVLQANGVSPLRIDADSAGTQ